MNPVVSASRELFLLAPSQRAVPVEFAAAKCDPALHDRLLREMQMFRGRIYLEDGAIRRSQLNGGRHSVEGDQASWHLLVLGPGGEIQGCARYREHPAGTDFAKLSVAGSPLASSREWGPRFQGAVEQEQQLSAQLDCPFSELGGWALDEEIRGSAEALRMALATYALTQELGGAIGLSSVTRRHGSASILRRMGGRPLQFEGRQLPAYYDPYYECEMELLRFYSWAPNPRYSVWIDELRADLRATQVVTSAFVGPEWVVPMRSRPLDQQYGWASHQPEMCKSAAV